MKKQVVTRMDTPLSDSPYSPTHIYGSVVFVSGQVPIDPQTGAIVSGVFKEQSEQVLQNLQALLEEADSSSGNVLKTTVFLASLEDFKVFSEEHYVGQEIKE